LQGKLATMKYRVSLLTAVALGCSNAGEAATDRDTRQVYEDFTQCIVKMYPEAAAQLVLSTERSDDFIKRHPNVVTSDCLLFDGSLIMPAGDYLRYGLAEALVRKEYAGGLPADIGQAGPVPHVTLNEAGYLPKPGKKLNPKELAKLQEQRNRDVAIRLVSIYGECIVRTDPAAALRLELTKPDSAQEAEAFNAMTGALSSCLPEGETIHLDKAVARGTVAMNLYRLAHAPRVQTATQAK
jgi:hypothetical protein